MKARLPKGVGGPTNMQGMIKQAQKMQEEMEAKQAELDVMEYEVTVKINGKQEVQSITIKPEVVDPDDIETLSDILVAAVNEAIKKVSETNNEAMSKITGGMNIPGLF